MKQVSSGDTVIIPGFRFAGISSGIKKSGEKDLAIIFSENIATLAGVFTTNNVKAAPVKLALERITLQRGQAIIINSGNANACTGKQGFKDAEEITSKTAEELGINADSVYMSSTGLIGKPLPMKKILKALPLLVNKMSPLFLDQVASAITTTDTFTKVISKKIKIGKKTGTIAGIAKGAGMISPNMATMLCFITTDIAVNANTLDTALREAVKNSFNRITVDNDMSTNDTVMIMANGTLKNKPFTKNSPFYHKFKSELCDITYELSRMIVRDGEGATKLIEIIVKGAKTETDAERVAKSVAHSMLVKTAIYGNDPNWGRIMAAVGYSGTDINMQKIDIFLGIVRVVSNGVGTDKDKIARKFLSKKDITITVDLHAGRKTATVLTCDLTEKYIKINAHYGT
jgi:glutamate N-acetyltransferase/amino-acid N-acetyltransferase